MTKHLFIWLMIRFSGFFLLVKSYVIIFKIPFLFVAILQFLPVSENDATSFLTVMVLVDPLAKGLLTVMVILYLLFRGRLLFKVIDRSASVCSEGALQKEEYVVILIRFVGLWWLYRAGVVLLRQANTFVGAIALKSYTYKRLLTDEQVEKFEEAYGMLDEMGNVFLLSRMVDIVVLAVLAWYFLKKGELIIRWFGNRWLGKEDTSSASVSEVTL